MSLEECSDDDDEDQPGQRDRDDQAAPAGVHAPIVVTATAAQGSREASSSAR